MGAILGANLRYDISNRSIFRFLELHSIIILDLDLDYSFSLKLKNEKKYN